MGGNLENHLFACDSLTTSSIWLLLSENSDNGGELEDELKKKKYFFGCYEI